MPRSSPGADGFDVVFENGTGTRFSLGFQETQPIAGTGGEFPDVLPGARARAAFVAAMAFAGFVAPSDQQAPAATPQGWMLESPQAFKKPAAPTVHQFSTYPPQGNVPSPVTPHGWELQNPAWVVPPIARPGLKASLQQFSTFAPFGTPAAPTSTPTTAGVQPTEPVAFVRPKITHQATSLAPATPPAATGTPTTAGLRDFDLVNFVRAAVQHTFNNSTPAGQQVQGNIGGQPNLTASPIRIPPGDFAAGVPAQAQTPAAVTVAFLAWDAPRRALPRVLAEAPRWPAQVIVPPTPPPPNAWARLDEPRFHFGCSVVLQTFSHITLREGVTAPPTIVDKPALSGSYGGVSLKGYVTG